MIPQPGLARRLPWPVSRNSYALGKNKSAPQRADLEEKGGRREGDVPAPLKVKLVGGTLHLCVAKGHSWGEGPWLTYSQ